MKKGFFEEMELGGIYSVTFNFIWDFNLVIDCKFIKVTKRGYNFLNVKTNKCISKHHWYPSKKKGEEMMFFVPKCFKIIKRRKKYSE